MISMLWRRIALFIPLPGRKGAAASSLPQSRRPIEGSTPNPGWPPTSGAGHRARLRALENDREPFDLLSEDW